MNYSGERLFQRQLSAATDPAGNIDLVRLRDLVVGAYAESDLDRRRTEQTAKMMATELEEVNIVLERSVTDLQAQNLRFEIALDNMANGLALFGPDGLLVVCNRRQLEILKIPVEQAVAGCTLGQFLRASPIMSEDLVQQRLCLANASIEGELLQTLIDEREVRVILRRTADGGFLTSCEDVTQRNRDASRLVFLAYNDPLTELPNRVLLRQRLEQRLQRGFCAVLCLDLDGFKIVNDTLGHAVGDALLRAVSGRLRNQIGADDTVARLGGDEFAAVIAGDMEAAMTCASRMIDLISAPFGINGHAVNISTSIGIAIAPADGQTPEELLIHADMALYQAKASGRCCIRAFNPAMVKAMHARQSLEQDLRIALAEGQFKLHYQSQVRVKDSSIIGFEALMRWHHPDRGWIAPNVFIPVAEESGLIIAIGEWVLREACQEAMHWPETVGIAVNVSTVQLRSNDLFHAVSDILRSTGLSPRRLELEVTETAFLNDNAAALEVMQLLRAMGVRIAMDDFGTGYSSLNYLQSFPFDVIKIDRSFVSRLGMDARAPAFIRAITGLGSSLGVPVIAEGVETAEQLELLAQENCNYAQGYLYSRPIPPAQVMKLLGLVTEEASLASYPTTPAISRLPLDGARGDRQVMDRTPVMAAPPYASRG